MIPKQQGIFNSSHEASELANVLKSSEGFVICFLWQFPITPNQIFFHTLWKMKWDFICINLNHFQYRLEDDDSFWLPNSAPSYDFNHHITDSNDHGKDDVLALSSFSLLDHSQRELPEEELHSMVGIVIAEQIEMAVRWGILWVSNFLEFFMQNNLQKLMLVSPSVFANSKAFDIFLGHLHALLSVQSLFESAMHLLARLLSKVW